MKKGIKNNKLSYNTILVCLFCLLRFTLFGQNEYVLKIGNSNIALELDTSISSNEYKSYKLKNRKDNIKIIFENVPSNTIKAISFEKGDTVEIVDDKKEFNISFVDTINCVKKISLKLNVNKKVLKDVQFQYQILSETIRVSNTFTKKILKGNEGKDKLIELSKLFNKGGIIISAITFYEEGVMHTLNIGYICLMEVES